MKKIFPLFCILLLSLCLHAQKEQRKIENIHKGQPTCLALSYTGQRAITGGTDNRANMWNLDDGTKLRSFAAQDNALSNVKFNNDESLFATSSLNNSIVVWDAFSMKPKKVLRETAPVLSIDFNPSNNNLLSLAGNGVVKLWDAVSGKVIRDNFITTDEKDFSSGAVAYSCTGKNLVIQVNDKIYLYNADGTLIITLAIFKTKFGKHGFDISPDGKILVIRSSATQICLVNVETGTITDNISGDFKLTTFIRFAQNANQFFCGTENGKIEFYKDKKLAKTFNAHTGAVIDAAISGDGNYLVSVGEDMSLKKWSVKEFELQYRISPSTGQTVIAQVSKMTVNDENQNGLLDGGEKASIDITVKNSGDVALYDGVAALSLESNFEGLEIPASVFVGYVQPGGEKSVSIPLSVSATLGAGSTNLVLRLKSGQSKLAEQSILLQAGSSSNAGVSIKSYKFFSPSGIASKAEPITLLVTIENVTRIAAENVLINYNFPVGVTPIEKNKETIASIPPGGQVTISVQFLIDKNFKGDTARLDIGISGVKYSNAPDIKMNIAVNKPIESQQDMLAALLHEQTTEKSRGSLVISKADIPVSNIESSHFVALVIGIDNYQGSWPKLSNAVNDAKAVAQTLEKQYGFTVRALYNEAATRQAIIKELEALVEKLNSTDNLVIFYSGHGDFKESLNRGFWVPVDAQTSSTSNFISNPDLQTFLSSIKAKHTLLISDACFSGDIFRGGDQKNEGPVNEKYYSRVNNLPSRQALTSGGLEPVMDGGREGHSVFTYYFLKILKENTQKYIDAEQLFDALKIPVVNNSNQAPKFSHIKNTGDEGGEFIFLKK